MLSVDLRRYLGKLLRWSWLIVVTAGLAAGVMYYAMQSTPPTYVSSTTLMVGDAVNNPNPGSAEFTTASLLADNYAQMAQRQPMLEATVNALGLPMSWETLRGRVLVVHPSTSQLFEIRVVDFDPYLARDIASALADQLIAASPTAANRKAMDDRRSFISNEVDVLQDNIERGKRDLAARQAELETETSARGVLDRQDEITALQQKIDSWRNTYTSLLASINGPQAPNTVMVVEPASLVLQSSGPNVRWNMLLAALGGLLVAVAGITLMEYLDDSVKTRSDVEGLLGAPVLGVISDVPAIRKGSDPVVVLSQPDSAASEAYRLLATNLCFASLDQPCTALLVTSAMSSEGKSVTAANLAAALARSGKKVLLVDLDLRTPTLHRLFGVPNEVGVTSMLLTPTLMPAYLLASSPLENLKLLCSGPVPPNPAELLSRFGPRLMQLFKGMADFVIVDAPPLLMASDAVILAGMVDGALMVVRSGRTRRGKCNAARQSLQRARAKLLGAVLNVAPKSGVELYGYSRYQKKGGGPKSSQSKERGNGHAVEADVVARDRG